jgi:hypothetical protein
MSVASVSPPARARRHALGLPAGSVRALHTLIIVGLFCGLVWMSPHNGRAIPIPPYLLCLLFLALGSFFAAHGNTIAPAGLQAPSPLHLPSGFVRLLILVGLLGTLIAKLVTRPNDLVAQISASVDLVKQEADLMAVILAVILGGFFLGVIFRWLTRGERSPWAQDFQAWVSLIAALGLGVAALIHLVIEPSMETRLNIPDWEGFLGGFVAFYFGERS